MAIKATLKQLATVLDEALLRSNAADGAAPTDAQQLADFPGHPWRPDGRAPFVAESISSLSDITVDMQAVRSFSTMQIPAPHALEPELLRPFESGEKAVVLLFPANGKTIPATLYATYPTHLLVDTEHSTVRHRPGEGLLVIFPILPDRRYVLQAVVEEVFAGRFKLGYLDPRYDTRRHIRLAEPALLRLVPPAVVTAIEQQQVRLIRHMTLPPSTSFSPRGSRISDWLYDLEANTLSPHMQRLESAPVMSGDLHDISRGGICLALDPAYQPDTLLQCLIRLQIVLPPAPPTSGNADRDPGMLTLLGVVRGVKTTATPCLLHVRFLQRLPEVYDTLLAALELLTGSVHYPSHFSPGPMP